MELSIDRFYQINRRALIWVALLAAIWLLRGYFDIIFLVFVLCYLTMPLSRAFQRLLRLPHYVATTLIFLWVLVVGAGFFQYVTPKIVGEVEQVVQHADELEAAVQNLHKQLSLKYPYLSKLVINNLRDSISGQNSSDHDGDRQSLATVPDEDVPILYIESLIADLRSSTPHAMMSVWQVTGTLLISLLFAYLISLDTARLRAEVHSLRNSRLKDFHEQTAGPLLNFANTLGRALQAQFVIACVNTSLTVIGMLLIGLPAVTALAFVVFLCSFIPVLGVLISTTPMVLVALGTGDFSMALWVILLVVIIHTIEAYILNPIIYGRHLHLNPVLVLIILYVGHRAFGVWGMLLGVPVAHYLIHDVLDIHSEKKLKEGSTAQTCD